MVPFKYCSRLLKDYKVDVREGQVIIKPDNAFIIL